MSNERLRSALVSAGVTQADLSEQIGVDPKTVERWISTGRVPHRTHRLKVAALLGDDEAFLWPSTKSDPRNLAASEAEFVTLYPNRGSVPIDVWEGLLERATDQVDLLAFAGSFFHDALPDFAEQLAAKARHGVRVRLLFGDPESPALELRGREEGIGDLLVSRCRLTWAYWMPFLQQPGIDARQHGSTLYASLFRFDDTVLANVHALGAPASHSPVLHLRKVAGGRLFTHYMSSFEKTWEAAVPAP
ncbi:XRE family transcriptional regulator [Nocardioides thalensis]|nr:XRE family transcriptional regulator [Nocardioides thalensis]